MKKILVTGCNGQLGRAIRAEYAQEEVTFINTDVVEGEGVTALDIADVDAVPSVRRSSSTVRRTRMWMPVRHSGMQRTASTRSVRATLPSLLRKSTQS